jgi:chromosome segregation ATPase
MTEQSNAGPGPSVPRPGGRMSRGEEPQSSDPQQLREEIAETREELGDTVEALVQKSDVKGQVQQKVAERRRALQAAQEQAKQKVAAASKQARQRPVPVVTAASLVLVGVVALWLIRRS